MADLKFIGRILGVIGGLLMVMSDLLTHLRTYTKNRAYDLQHRPTTADIHHTTV